MDSRSHANAVESKGGMAKLRIAHGNRPNSTEELDFSFTETHIHCVTRHAGGFPSRHPVLFPGFRPGDCRNDDSWGGQSILL